MVRPDLERVAFDRIQSFSRLPEAAFASEMHSGTLLNSIERNTLQGTFGTGCDHADPSSHASDDDAMGARCDQGK
jgi:hypothetical protein